MWRLPERIRDKISVDADGCWIWTGARHPMGYGQTWWDGAGRRAHRVVYELIVGPLPDPKELECDHVCRVPACVNPEHIELVTHRENAIRGRAGETSKARAKARTHCPKGHEFDGTDNRGWQICLVCRAEASRRYEGG